MMPAPQHASFTFSTQAFLYPHGNIQSLTDVPSFIISLLRLRIDNHVHWRRFWKDYGNMTPFATRGKKYIRKSMLRSLATYHGLMSEEKLDSFFGAKDTTLFENE